MVSEFSLKREKERQKQRHAEGKCIQCGEVDSNTLDGKMRCKKCSFKNQMRRVELWNSRLEQGLCERCGKEPFEPGKKMCRKCLDLYKK